LANFNPISVLVWPPLTLLQSKPFINCASSPAS
jgi:hypothetical protein